MTQNYLKQSFSSGQVGRSRRYGNGSSNLFIKLALSEKLDFPPLVSLYMFVQSRRSNILVYSPGLKMCILLSQRENMKMKQVNHISVCSL